MNIINLDLFIDVMRVGNFSDVARKRNIAPSSVSRAITALETEFDVALFYRTTRKISPTEAAFALMNLAETPLAELQNIRTAIRDTSGKTTGVLRVSASHTFGAKCISPLLSGFRAQYPDVLVELILNDAKVDIVGEGYDLALRHGPLIDSSLTVKRIMNTKYFVCASPEYLEHAGVPKFIKELKNLPCLVFPLPGFANIWKFKPKTGQVEEVSIYGKMKANSGFVLRDCALNGDGIVLLSDWLIGEDLATGKLVDIFPNYKVTPTQFDTAISALYPHRKHTPKKVTAFIDYIRSHLAKA